MRADGYTPPTTEHLLIEIETGFCGKVCSKCDDNGEHKGHHKSVEDMKEVDMELTFD